MFTQDDIEALANYVIETQGRNGAIAALTNIQGGQFTIANTNNGRVLTTATATNKSFTYTIDPSWGPRALMTLAYLAKQFIRSRTDEQLDAYWSHRRKKWAVMRFQ